MENMIYCLNATIPIFLTLLMGLFFRHTGLFDDSFVNRLNKFVFHAALPALLFEDIATSDFTRVWNTKFVMFCFCVTFISIAISFALSFCFKVKEIRGEFIQASYRSSAAILGIAIIQNLYGKSGMAPLMIIGSVPLYNIMAVTVLSLFAPRQKKLSRETVKNTLKGILTNPIILGILAGVLWSLLKLPMPVILEHTVNNLGKTATPLGLMAMGGALKFGKAFKNPLPVIACSFMKLAGFEILFLPLAIFLGFSQEMLVAIIIMLGSASTVSCYIMAKNMGYDGDFTSGVVIVTTLLSSFTLTLWLYICRILGLI